MAREAPEKILDFGRQRGIGIVMYYKKRNPLRTAEPGCFGTVHSFSEFQFVSESNTILKYFGNQIISNENTNSLEKGFYDLHYF